MMAYWSSSVCFTPTFFSHGYLVTLSILLVNPVNFLPPSGFPLK